MRSRIAIGIIAALVLMLGLLSIYVRVTKESLEHKICHNQVFMLEKMEQLTVTNKSLFSMQIFQPEIQKYQAFTYLDTMKEDIFLRRIELAEDYC